MFKYNCTLGPPKLSYDLGRFCMYSSQMYDGTRPALLGTLTSPYSPGSTAHPWAVFLYVQDINPGCHVLRHSLIPFDKIPWFPRYKLCPP